MRGTPSPDSAITAARRFIPACAGNTRCPWRCVSPAPVHPRVCGEHCAAPDHNPHTAGSSPRVRGTPHRRRGSPTISRFIPACAGNTRRLRRKSVSFAGSSPRVRGTRRRCRDQAHSRRFIPACAGNTAAPALSPSQGTVHPRVCGEHAKRDRQDWDWSGSSPRVRGTRAAPLRPAGQQRFIPACAGNTPSPARAAPVPAVHPRVCGEHAADGHVAVVADGSSPRVRGTHRARPERPDDPRFIPACAGNTAPLLEIHGALTVHPRVCGEHPLGRTPRASQWTVHPRVCGEHSLAPPRCGPARGSSPRVRGTRPGRRPRPAASRFIPACAGNTSAKHRRKTATPVHPRVCGEHPRSWRR